MLALVRPTTWWRRWFPVTEVVMAGLFALTVLQIGTGAGPLAVLFLVDGPGDPGRDRLPRATASPTGSTSPPWPWAPRSIVVASLGRCPPRPSSAPCSGALSYAGTLLFVAHIAYPRGMGWGDVKLAWLMGFYLGWFGWEGGFGRRAGPVAAPLRAARRRVRLLRRGGDRRDLRPDPPLDQGRVPLRPVAGDRVASSSCCGPASCAEHRRAAPRTLRARRRATLYAPLRCCAT